MPTASKVSHIIGAVGLVLVTVLYIALLLIPWVYTCDLSTGPVWVSNPKTWTELPRGVEPINVDRMADYDKAIKILNTITSIVAIPVVYAVVQRAASVGSQSKHNLWDNAALSWLAVILIMITLILPPIRTLVVSHETIKVPTSFLGQGVKALDATPQMLEMVSENGVVEKVKHGLVNSQESDRHPQLWPEAGQASDVSTTPSLGGFRPANEPDIMDLSHQHMFVSLVPRLNTGYYRSHALRMKSLPDCKAIAQFPPVCSGPRPFARVFESPNTLVTVCVPGASGRSPWPDRSQDRREIKEDLFIRMVRNVLTGDVRNPSQIRHQKIYHCTATTTRGYFELPNYLNEEKVGPLLNTFPDLGLDDLEGHFVDVSPNRDVPLGSPDFVQNFTSDPFLSLGPTEPSNIAPGPLMISAQALFGNQTWFHTLARAFVNSTASNNSSLPRLDALETLQMVCSENNMPLARFSAFPPAEMVISDRRMSKECQSVLTPRSRQEDRITEQQAATKLENMMNDFLSVFERGPNTTLWTAMVLANEAVLQAATQDSTLARKVFVDLGQVMTNKPVLTQGAVVGVSLLVAFQVLGLVVLGVYLMIGSFEPAWFIKRFAGDGETGAGSKGVTNEYDEEPLRDLSTPAGSERR
ncbi:uncharacterized protein QC763_000570 [Podospora pseudopauciseta]|uniref:Transmembrane protein n=1 Tax=Podospora pseudopauciseta TaxID=2093780 RepID=A0ABR0HKB5_9PEZI|nr:hypothetical protein QC763_000570 [Podospora pseudopauciseta]